MGGMVYFIEGLPPTANVELMDSVVLHSFEELGLDHDLTITIIFDKDMAPNHTGYADEDEDGYVVGVRPRLPLGQTVRTIFHEFGHVLQMVEDRFHPRDPDTDYWTDPCEVEAFEIEDDLLHTFLDKHPGINRRDRKKLAKRH